MTPQKGASGECEHHHLSSTLMWPPEANSVRCEDCGHVLREAWSNLKTSPKGEQETTR